MNFIGLLEILVLDVPLLRNDFRNSLDESIAIKMPTLTSLNSYDFFIFNILPVLLNLSTLFLTPVTSTSGQCSLNQQL